MSDIADQAQDVIEQHLTASLANRKHSINPAIPSAKHCDDCESEIPEARRRSLPGVRLCVDCASLQEIKGRHQR